MKIFSYIWLFSIWFTVTIITGPKDTGKLNDFVEDAEWADYSLGTLINFCYATLICLVLSKTILFK